MSPESFPIDAYLARIGLKERPSLNTAGLAVLMRAQLFTVPFENTYVQAGLEVSLEPEMILDKIITQGRGGYCYEVNGLFAWAAAALGFNVQLIGARPMFYAKRWAKTHMVVMVELPEGKFICDTGFGRFGLRAPLRLTTDSAPIQQDWDLFRLRQEQQEWVLQAFSHCEWENQFSFDEQPVEMVDFMPANFFNSHSPEAIFVQKLVIVQHQKEARVILLGDQLKIIRAEGVEEITLKEPIAERLARFGLTWPV